MAKNIDTCPHCGNIVEGKRVQSYATSLTKTGVKSAASGIADVASAGAGAVIGTAVGGPIGTILGGAAGWLAGLAAKNKVNQKIDNEIDDMRSEEYEYTCPKCGCKWAYSQSDPDVRVITKRGSGAGNSSYGVPRSSSTSSSVTPRSDSSNTDLRKQVLKYIRPCFMTSERISLDTYIVPYMINKLDLMHKLEGSKKYNCYLTRDEITACNTVRDLVDLIIKESGV